MGWLLVFVNKVLLELLRNKGKRKRIRAFKGFYTLRFHTRISYRRADVVLKAAENVC